MLLKRERAMRVAAEAAVRRCGHRELIRAIVNDLDWHIRQADCCDERRARLKKAANDLVTIGGLLKVWNDPHWPE